MPARVGVYNILANILYDLCVFYCVIYYHKVDLFLKYFKLNGAIFEACCEKVNFIGDDAENYELQFVFPGLVGPRQGDQRQTNLHVCESRPALPASGP